jgi:hypothetical protein
MRSMSRLCRSIDSAKPVDDLRGRARRHLGRRERWNISPIPSRLPGNIEWAQDGPATHNEAENATALAAYSPRDSCGAQRKRIERAVEHSDALISTPMLCAIPVRLADEISWPSSRSLRRRRDRTNSNPATRLRSCCGRDSPTPRTSNASDGIPRHAKASRKCLYLSTRTSTGRKDNCHPRPAQARGTRRNPPSGKPSSASKRRAR